jgi:hypothetical protein
MKMYYENKKRMYDTVLEYLQANPVIIALLAGLNLSVTAFATIIAAIATEMVKINADYNGITLNKATARQMLEQSTSSIGNAIMAYANTIDDNELYVSVDKVFSKLEKLTEQELIDVCKNIHDIGVEQVANLAPWGITIAILDSQKSNWDAYKALKDKKRQKQTSQSTSQTVAKGLFKQADKLLKRTIDKAIFSLEPSQPTFVENYRKNRKILNLGHHFTTFKGEAKNKKNGVVLSNVELEFLNSKGETFTISTDATGKYRERLDPDTYKITAIHPDMQPFIIEGVQIQPGEIKIENIEMLPKA